MLEVPADKHIDSGYRGKGDVQGIRAHAPRNGPVQDVGSSEFFRLWGNRDEFDVRVRHARHCPPDCLGSSLQFAEYELGKDKDHLAGNKCVHLRPGSPEFNWYYAMRPQNQAGDDLS